MGLPPIWVRRTVIAPAVVLLAAFLITTLVSGSNELVALRHAYHGRSFATTNASQTPWRASTLSPLHVHYVGNPYCYRCPWEKTYPSCDLLCARDVEAVIRTTTSGQPAARQEITVCFGWHR